MKKLDWYLIAAGLLVIAIWLAGSPKLKEGALVNPSFQKRMEGWTVADGSAGLPSAPRISYEVVFEQLHIKTESRIVCVITQLHGLKTGRWYQVSFTAKTSDDEDGIDIYIHGDGKYTTPSKRPTVPVMPRGQRYEFVFKNKVSNSPTLTIYFRAPVSEREVYLDDFEVHQLSRIRLNAAGHKTLFINLFVFLLGFRVFKSGEKRRPAVLKMGRVLSVVLLLGTIALNYWIMRLPSNTVQLSWTAPDLLFTWILFVMAFNRPSRDSFLAFALFIVVVSVFLQNGKIHEADLLADKAYSFLLVGFLQEVFTNFKWKWKSLPSWRPLKK